MASGSFERVIRTDRTAAECWAVLTDVDRISSWVDIVRDVITHRPLESYRATLEDRVGPFRLRADLDIGVTDAIENERISFQASGQDRQVGSRLSVRAAMALAAVDGVTTVTFEGAYSVEGRVATVGAPMIRRKAEAILEKFTTRAERELQ